MSVSLYTVPRSVEETTDDNIRSISNDGRNRVLWPLPSTWRWSTIGDLTEVIRGASPRPKGDPRYFGGDVPWIMIADVTRQPGKYLYKTREGVTEAGAALSRRIPAGELILSNSATVCVPKILKVDGCIHDGFVAFPTLKERVDLNFAYYWFEFIRPTMIRENRQGVTQVNLNTGIVRAMHFPLAPRPEQQRIVAEIEKQFTRLEAGVTALRRVQANLKRYRAAVLKAACEGKLVPTEAELAKAENRKFEPGEELLVRILAERRQDWEGRGKYTEPAPPDTAKLPVIPEGWTWATVEQVATRVQYGSSAKTSEGFSGIPVLRMGNIQEGKLDFHRLKYLPASHHEFPELLLVTGDVLFNRTNSAELVGKTAVFKGNPDPCSFALYLIRIRTADGCLPDFLSYFINSVFGRAWIAGCVSQQVGQANVNGTKLQALAIPLPPLAERTRIVGEVERRLSLVEELEAVASANLQRASRLRQSILERAFTGALK